VFLYHQVAMPPGYNPAAFHGPWPPGGAWVIKMLVSPNMKAWRTPGNWHTVSVILAHGQNAANHLMLGPLLQRLVSHHCDCKAGARTNSTCSHVVAVLIALFAPNCYLPTKVLEPRLQDPQR
jgi:hypothetical protein